MWRIRRSGWDALSDAYRRAHFDALADAGGFWFANACGIAHAGRADLRV